MTLAEFALLVQGMRDAQRNYFKSRSTPALDLSKRLERQVHEAVDSVLKPDLFSGKETP